MTRHRPGHPAVVLTTMALLTGTLLGALAATTHRPPPLTYCQYIGDDDCDGTIRPWESGWPCVPPQGGPLLCHVDHQP